jgi:uncharacterized protein (DUF433 family)
MSKLVVEIIGGESYEYYPMGDYVVRAKGVCGGRPTFKYTRIQVEGTLGRIAAGEDIDAIVEGYRGRVPKEAILEAMRIAEKGGKKICGRMPKSAPRDCAR